MQWRDFNPAAPGRIERPPGTSAVEWRELSLPLASGQTVKGWAIEPRNGWVVVYLHGAPGDRRSLLPLAQSLAADGYGALLPDLPGHGESPGRADWGASFDEALRRLVEHARTGHGARHVALVGHSMGAALAARHAAGSRPVPDALVLLAPFTDLDRQIRYQYRHRVGLLEEVALLATRRSGVEVEKIQPIEWLRSAPARPLLIIGGGRDNAVPASMLRELHDASPAPRSLWVVEEAGHSDLRQVAGAEHFDARLREFLASAGNKMAR